MFFLSHTKRFLRASSGERVNDFESVAD